MQNRLHLDQEIDVPLGLIDSAYWNPKSVISGVYRKGLEGSLELLGNRDRLHIWPRPDAPGRYYVLDGNQRLAVIHWAVTVDLARKDFGLDADAKDTIITDLIEDPANSFKVASIRSRAATYLIPSQVVTRFDADTPFTLAHAKQWTLIWNRNHAKFDEPLQTALYREILPDILARTSENQRKFVESRMKSIVRPELPHVDAPPPPKADDAFQFAAPGEFTPSEEQPWGPPPEQPSSTVPIPQSTQLIPMVFSFTPDGYREIENHILKSRSRLFRETKLMKALEKLETSMPSKLDAAIDSIIVETALRICDLNLEAARDSK